jgi:hypothetical protein
MFKLLGDSAYYAACSAAIRERVRRYYDKRDMLAAYRTLYETLIEAPDAGEARKQGRRAWRA